MATYSCKSKETMSAILHNDQGTYDKAIEQAKFAIEKNPNDADAHFELGRSYSFTGDMAGAYKEFQTAARLDPEKVNDAETGIKSNWAKHFNAGISEFQTENLAGAAHEFELTTQSDPRQIKGWLNLAKVYAGLAVGDSTYTPQEYATVDTLIAMTKDDSEDYASRPRPYRPRHGQARDEGRSSEDLREAPARRSGELRRGRARGQQVPRRQRIGRTGPRFLQMAVDARKKTDSEDFESYYNLGVAYFNAKDCPRTIEAYLAAYDIDPENRQGNYSLLLAYYTCEMYDDAMLQGQKYTEKFGEDPNGWRLSEPFLQQERHEDQSGGSREKIPGAIAVTIDSGERRASGPAPSVSARGRGIGTVYAGDCIREAIPIILDKGAAFRNIGEA